jgi:hypothetical protein
VHYNSTKVMAKLDQDQLEQIIYELNRTLSGHFKPDHRFDIDLNNPIHVNMGMEPVQYPQNSFRMGTNDYLNYA